MSSAPSSNSPSVMTCTGRPETTAACKRSRMRDRPRGSESTADRSSPKNTTSPAAAAESLMRRNAAVSDRMLREPSMRVRGARSLPGAGQLKLKSSTPNPAQATPRAVMGRSARRPRRSKTRYVVAERTIAPRMMASVMSPTNVGWVYSPPWANDCSGRYRRCSSCCRRTSKAARSPSLMGSPLPKSTARGLRGRPRSRNS